MTTDPQQTAPPESGAEQQTTGFVVCESLLEDMSKAGKSKKLESWVSGTRQKLDEYRGSAASQKAKKEADRVQRAWDAAEELIRGIHSGKMKRD
ncbi:MAG: hypothetical protein JSV78_09285 [Phycisphaerales bacterium]|nr:MAG: hypothetical protein JSV78_09285 [Phycisphaerales bacterium]